MIVNQQAQGHAVSARRRPLSSRWSCLPRHPGGFMYTWRLQLTVQAIRRPQRRLAQRYTNQSGRCRCGRGRGGHLRGWPNNRPSAPRAAPAVPVRVGRLRTTTVFSFMAIRSRGGTRCSRSRGTTTIRFDPQPPLALDGACGLHLPLRRSAPCRPPAPVREPVNHRLSGTNGLGNNLLTSPSNWTRSTGRSPGSRSGWKRLRDRLRVVTDNAIPA